VTQPLNAESQLSRHRRSSFGASVRTEAHDSSLAEAYAPAPVALDSQPLKAPSSASDSSPPVSDTAWAPSPVALHPPSTVLSPHQRMTQNRPPLPQQWRRQCQRWL